MEVQKTIIPLSDGESVEGLLNWAVIYRLENSGKFDEILKNFMRVYQNGVDKDRQYMDIITVLYTAYLGKNYGSKDGYMEFEEFLERIPFANPSSLIASYTALFYKKKQDFGISSGD